MSLGLVIAGLVVGGAVRHRAKVKQQERQLEAVRSQVAQLQREKAKSKSQINNLKNELKNVKSQPVKTVVNYNSSKKERFYDTYRALDVKLSRVVGKGEYGVNMYIRSSQNKNTNKNAVAKLIRCKDYRNMISHGKDKWKNMPDPETWMTGFLEGLLHDLKCNSSKYSNLLRTVANQYKDHR